MTTLNVFVLMVLADLERRRQGASVVIQRKEVRRIIHVSDGQLVLVDSNLKAERLGDMLAGEGLLDPVLIEPVAAEAAKHGKLLGDQLVIDGLLTASDLAQALERQVYFRLGAALAMRGEVRVEPLRPVKPVLRVPVAAALLTAFRHWVPLAAVEGHLADEDRERRTLDVSAPAFLRLELGPAELRFSRRLAAGETLDALFASGAPREPVLRLAGALSAAGLWG